MQTRTKTCAKSRANPPAPGGQTARQPIRLTLQANGAEAVFVAGTFNDWHPKAAEMINTGSGLWVKELELLPGCHEYRFVVDGAWVADPANPASAPNPFGGRNSILVVPPINP